MSLETILKKAQTGPTRTLSVVSMQRLVQVAGIVVTVALVPRLFGAQDYGRFAFVLSLSYLGQILGDFGTLDVMGRFVPGMSRREAGRLYMRSLAFKLLAGVVCGAITFGAALALGRWMRPEWAALAGLSVALHIIAWVPFQFALGLNRVGVWMAEQAWRQWALLALLLLFLPPLGLGGALLALVAMETLFCGLGLWWLRDHWRAAELGLDWGYLRPFLRFGAGFFLANLVTTFLYRSGPVLVEALTGDSAQTGFFNLAIGLFLLAYITISQFAQSLLPALSELRSQGRPEEAKRWLRRFVRYAWSFGWLATLAVWLLADWGVPRVFGPDFAPAATVLKWIGLGIPLAALLWAGNLVATLSGRGAWKFAASLAGLLTFLGVALILVPAYRAGGAALALSLATLVNVVVLSLALRRDFAPGWRMVRRSALAGALGLVVVLWLSQRL